MGFVAYSGVKKSSKPPPALLPLHCHTSPLHPPPPNSPPHTSAFASPSFLNFFLIYFSLSSLTLIFPFNTPTYPVLISYHFSYSPTLISHNFSYSPYTHFPSRSLLPSFPLISPTYLPAPPFISFNCSTYSTSVHLFSSTFPTHTSTLAAPPFSKFFLIYFSLSSLTASFPLNFPTYPPLISLQFS